MVELASVDVDEVLTCIRTAVRLAQNEEEVRVRVSKCIEEKILKPLGITQVGHYEYTLISGVRVDALSGHVIIEYKAPGRLSTKSDIAKAKEQVIRYICEEAKVKERYKNFIGVIISDRIAFVRYDFREDSWVLRGPYDITRETVIKLVEAIRGLQRKSLEADALIRDFGPASIIARKVIKLLYERLTRSNNPRVVTLFSDWKRLFTQATGYSPEKLKKLKSMAKDCGISGDIDYDAFLFSIHTYYALIMKLLAAEIAYLYGQGKWLRSYVAELENAYLQGGINGLKQVLSDLESGGIFAR
ncbi:class I SAM-dependent DNA methyltransferase, partial [Nanoarchaeota archaeon]